MTNDARRTTGAAVKWNQNSGPQHNKPAEDAQAPGWKTADGRLLPPETKTSWGDDGKLLGWDDRNGERSRWVPVEWVESNPRRVTDLEEGDGTWRTSWAPDESAGSDAAPERLSRSDGEHLLYTDKLHWLQGEPESGKTFFALKAAAETLNDGGTVLFVDFEDSGASVRGRLQAMGADTENFIYVRPTEPLGEDASNDVGRLMAMEPTLVILDGVAECMALHGLDPIRSQDTARFVHEVVDRFRGEGVTTICIDHVARGEAGKGRYAYGSQHKLAAVDGAAYRFEVIQPFSREQGGAARVDVAKDRPGFVRSFAIDKERAGALRVIPSENGIEVTVEPPMQEGGDDLSFTQRRVLDVLPGADDGFTYRQIGDELARDGKGKPLKRSTIQDALGALIDLELADTAKSDGTASRFWTVSKGVPESGT